MILVRMTVGLRCYKNEKVQLVFTFEDFAQQAKKLKQSAYAQKQYHKIKDWKLFFFCLRVLYTAAEAFLFVW